MSSSKLTPSVSDLLVANTPELGPKYYLSTSRPGGQPAMEYVPKDAVTQVSEYVDNYRVVHEILEEVCNISRELLRRRKPL